MGGRPPPPRCQSRFGVGVSPAPGVCVAMQRGRQHRRDGLTPRFVYRLADTGSDQSVFNGPRGDDCRVHIEGRAQREAQQHALSIAALVQRLPGARDALARQQHGVEALRPAQRVTALQQTEQGGCVQRLTALHAALLARGHFGEFATLKWHAQPLTQRAQRRQVRAERVTQAGEPLRQGATELG